MKTGNYIKFAAEISSKNEKIYRIFILRVILTAFCIISGCFICFLFENKKIIQDFFSIVVCLIIFLLNIPLEFEMKKRMLKIMDSKINLKRIDFRNFWAFFAICLIKRVISEIFVFFSFVSLDFAYKNVVFNANAVNMFENAVISSVFFIISLFIILFGIYFCICFSSVEFFYVQAIYFYIAIMEYENGVFNKWNEKNSKRKSRKKCCLEIF